MTDFSKEPERRNVLVLGSINTDYVVASARLPRPGETVVGGHFVEARGGKGANQAVAAARAGARVTLIGAVGSDVQGAAAVSALQADGICVDYVECVSGAASGVALILVDEHGENCISVASGANSLISVSGLAQVPDTVFEQSSVFLTNHEIPMAAVKAALVRAKAFGLTTILNPAPADKSLLQNDTLQHVDVITPNETEASLLTDSEVSSVDSAERAARALQSLGPQTVIITLGKAGCMVVHGDSKPVQIPAFKVDVVDTTAAGDAFNGVLAAALAEDRDLLDAVRWATRAAALSVTTVGAQPSLPRRSEIDASFRADTT